MATSTATKDGQLMGAEIMFGSTRLGHVEGLSRDPISRRVRRLITSYGPNRRRVGCRWNGLSSALPSGWSSVLAYVRSMISPIGRGRDRGRAHTGLRTLRRHGLRLSLEYRSQQLTQLVLRSLHMQKILD